MVFSTREVRVLVEKSQKEHTVLSPLHDGSQWSLFLVFTSCVLLSHNFPRPVCVIDGLQRCDNIWLPRLGHKKDFSFCLRCSHILLDRSLLWEAVICGDTQGACGETHLTRKELKPTSVHTSEFGSESSAPVEPWLIGWLQPHERFCADHPAEKSCIPDPQKLWDKPLC